MIINEWARGQRQVPTWFACLTLTLFAAADTVGWVWQFNR